MTTLARPFLVALLIVGVAACTGGGGGPTVAKLEEAQTQVHAFQPKADAIAKLEALLGPAQSKEETAISWVAKDGDSCKKLEVTLVGDNVGTVTLAKADCP